jgi:hypothetical protein
VAGVSEEDVRRLVSVARRRRFSRGEVLARTSRATVKEVLRKEQRRGNLELQRGRTVVLEPEELERRDR